MKTFFQALNLVIFLPFLKHQTTIQTRNTIVRSQAAKFKLLEVLLTTTTMNVGNRWHSTAGPKINVMRDFSAKTCSAVCP